MSFILINPKGPLIITLGQCNKKNAAGKALQALLCKLPGPIQTPYQFDGLGKV